MRGERKLASLGLGRAVCLEFCAGNLDHYTLLPRVLRTGAGLNGSSLGPVQHRAWHYMTSGHRRSSMGSFNPR